LSQKQQGALPWASNHKSEAPVDVGVGRRKIAGRYGLGQNQA
jgi:hypothetical protein